MNSSPRAILIWLSLTTVVLFACAGIPAIGANETAQVDTPYGPQISLTEHQTAVFEEIFGHVEESYIYYKLSDMDWDALHQEYLDKINQGMSDTEFTELMTEFEEEFPEGEIVYVTRQERIEADTAANTTTYGGIGAFVNFEPQDVPHVVILDVIPGSPAEQAGLKAHDSVYAVNGSPVLLEEGSDVVLRIRGETGTKVTLTVQSPGKEQREVEITRATINSAVGLNASELPNTDIGYIRMPTVGSTDLMTEVLNQLENFQSNGDFKGLIIDLRISGANSNFPLQDMLTLFLDRTIIDIFNRIQTNTALIEGQDFSGSLEMPIVVLVGEHTIGAAEIFAGAIQEAGRGTVIGSNTSGSIESLSGFSLSNGAQIFIASTSYRVGGSEQIGINGLSPEVRVEARWDEIDPSKDPVIQNAIDILEVPVEEVQP